jgi:hypothetical protein
VKETSVAPYRKRRGHPFSPHTFDASSPCRPLSTISPSSPTPLLPSPAPQAQSHQPPGHLDHRCDGSFSTNVTTSTNTQRIPTCQAIPGRVLSSECSFLSSVSPAGSSSGTPQQVLIGSDPPGPPNRPAPATSTNNESQGCFLIGTNNSWRVSILLVWLVSTFNLFFRSSNSPRSNVSDISQQRLSLPRVSPLPYR